MKFYYRFIALFFLFSSSAFASNYYVGLNLGLNEQSGKLKVIDETINPAVDIDAVLDYKLPDDSSLNYSVFAGYKLGRDLILEIGFAVNDDIDSSIRQTTNGIDVLESSSSSYYYAAFVGMWPISGNWAFNARLGFSVWDLDYDQIEVDTSLLPSDAGYVINEQSFSDSTSGMLIGIGGSYGYNENLEFKLSLDSHLVDFAFTNLDVDYDSTVLTVGVIYHF